MNKQEYIKRLKILFNKELKIAKLEDLKATYNRVSKYDNPSKVE